ncbi:putative c2h2 finger domain protein [Daldinia childiae]|uniref:putative c2h2 finger domain protein n=1 Tax=Daldinia childiae TaxID=326645 RepID=UPI0014483600|nr:putative c2h2 finger domain protein [Daldinia childiae]KAF3056210.1 putative c2h2 finger domain protein [Daldinia childiae]
MASKQNGTGTPHLRCAKCMAAFADLRDLYLHQQKRGHLACGSCKQSFHDINALIKHREENHKAEQDLPCPGCGTKFVSAGTWMRHIERGECHAIFPSEISGNIVQAVDSITKALGESKFEDVDYTVNPGKSFTEISDVWGDEWKKEQSLDARDHPERFPRTAQQEFYQGGSKQTDLLTGDDGANLEQRPFNAWAQKKNLFPEKAADRAVPPPPSLLENVTRPSSSAQPTGERITNPDNPGFNAGLFWNPLLGIFKCPHKDNFSYKECGSKHTTAQSLIAHLKSSAHTSTRFQCPGCTSVFTSGSGWVQHADSVNEKKCRIRNTGFYRQVLSTATKGALSIDDLIKLENDTAKVKFDDDWATSKQRGGPGPVPGSEAWVKEKEAGVSKSQSDSEKSQPGPKKSQSGAGTKITHEEYTW